MSPEEMLLIAARMVCHADEESEPWNYGWCVEEYRRSGHAAVSGEHGPRTLVGEALDAYEQCMQQLLKDAAVKERWDLQELWGVVASLVVVAADAPDPPELIAAGLRRLREAGPSLVLLPLANVTWEAGPRVVAGGVLGRLNDAFQTAVNAEARGRIDLAALGAHEWVVAQTLVQSSAQGTGRDVIVAAFWTPGQMMSASDRAGRWLEDICCLALLFENDLYGREMWSLRGAHNRPGVRGLVQDRTTLERVLAGDSHGRMELASQPFVTSPTFGTQQPLHWYNSDPVPLDQLLTGTTLDRLDKAVAGQGAVHRRMRVAARWYADAHWALNAADAALALGVALDALVGSRSGLPGRAMSQRFAHLERDPARRRERQARYNELYSVRSAVAHGGAPARLNEDAFVRSTAEDVRWAADRLLAFADRFSVTSDAELDVAFEGLALGEQIW